MASVFAIIIFAAMFVLIILDKWPREITTSAAAALTIIIVFGICMHSGQAILETLNLHAFAQKDFWYVSELTAENAFGINWSTIVFIAGMMVMVEGMAETGFFQWLCLKMAKLAGYRAMPLLAVFMMMSFVLAMFIDSITVILFLATITIELARILKFEAGSMIMAEIFCANLGGSATMSGDPPNIIIGTSLGFGFMDFLKNCGPIAVVSLAAVLVYYLLITRRGYGKHRASPEEIADLPEAREVITDRLRFCLSTAIFLAVVVLLVTHAQTGLTVATIGCIAAGLTMLLSGRHFFELAKNVDYRTLLFFIGLFVVIGGMEETGVLEAIAHGILRLSGGSRTAIIIIILWVSAVFSAFIDNIPFAATMVPVLKVLAAASGAPLPVLAWSLAIGADIGGSATPIGASANVVGVNIAGRSGITLGWKRYCRESVPATVLVLLIASLFLLFRY